MKTNKLRIVLLILAAALVAIPMSSCKKDKDEKGGGHPLANTKWTLQSHARIISIDKDGQVSEVDEDSNRSVPLYILSKDGKVLMLGTKQEIGTYKYVKGKSLEITITAHGQENTITWIPYTGKKEEKTE